MISILTHPKTKNTSTAHVEIAVESETYTFLEVEVDNLDLKRVVEALELSLANPKLENDAIHVCIWFEKALKSGTIMDYEYAFNEFVALKRKAA